MSWGMSLVKKMHDVVGRRWQVGSILCRGAHHVDACRATMHIWPTCSASVANTAGPRHLNVHLLVHLLVHTQQGA